MAEGIFTKSDLVTIGKAASVSELLTRKFFNLAEEEWKRNPYDILTRSQVASSLYERDVFAHVIRYGRHHKRRESESQGAGYGIVLQDPNILLALLRSCEHDLWTMGLFILTHELIHIVRFRRFGVDFFAGAHERDREEKLVHGMTREILSDVSNTAHILNLYKDHTAFLDNNLP
jgi:hypothetical protein